MYIRENGGVYMHIFLSELPVIFSFCIMSVFTKNYIIAVVMNYYTDSVYIILSRERLCLQSIHILHMLLKESITQ